MKFGISKAQTYHWLHAMNVLGQYQSTITADYPVAVAFKKNGVVRHVAYNYDSTPRTVTFSDGTQLVVAARSMGIDDGVVVPGEPQVQLTAPAEGAVVNLGETVALTASASVEGSTISQVDFLVDGVKIGEATSEPYTAQWTPTEKGTYSLTAQATAANGTQTISSAVTVTVKASTDPDPDPQPGTGGCSVTSDELSEGAGMSYRLSFATASDGSVTVTAEALTEVEGLVAFVRDLTDGFTETQMTAAEGQKFTATISGHSKGEAISVACKFAWASGGIAVTAPFTYTVGDNCKGDNVRELTDAEVRIYPVPATDRLTIEMPAADNHVWAWSADGSLVLDRKAGAKATVDVSRWAPGVYFVRIESGNAVAVRRIVKR